MRTVSALDVRKHLGELLDAASAGERIVIERDRRPMAVLVSYDDAQRLDEARDEILQRRLAALERLDGFRARMAVEYPADPDGVDTATWIQQDRERRTDQIDRAARGESTLDDADREPAG